MERPERPGKHTLLVWGTNPQTFRAPHSPNTPLPVCDEELHRIGISAGKIPHVKRELARLLDAKPEWNNKNTALKLAKEIAKRLW